MLLVPVQYCRHAFAATVELDAATKDAETTAAVAMEAEAFNDWQVDEGDWEKVAAALDARGQY